jgi:Uma2 family endonuclease
MLPGYNASMTMPAEKPRRYSIEEYLRIADDSEVKLETLINPGLVIEVLSRSTERNDRGEKFTRYRELKSLQEYILVSQHRPQVETFFRQPDGTWLLTPYSGMEALVRLRSLEIDLPMSEIYAGVEFPPEQEEKQAFKPADE